MPYDGTPQEPTVADVLRRGRERLSNPANWCQGQVNQKRPNADGGVAMCSVGTADHFAQALCGPDAHVGMLMLATHGCLGDAIEASGRYRGICAFNNSVDHATLLQVWDDAIALAEKEKAHAA